MKPRALITGASGGIGLAIARLLAASGHDLILVARSQGKLEALAAELAAAHGCQVIVLAADLADPAAPAALAAEIEARKLAVDVLVNNAGVGVYGPFATNDWTRERDIIQINVTSLVDLTKRLLPGMVARGRGRILNVASTAAFQPGPLMAIYYASKAFVLSFSEALGNELGGSGVSVTALCPGPTATGFEAAADLGASRLFRMGTMSMEDVARAGVDAMMNGRSVVIPGLRNWLMTQSLRISPRFLVTRVVRWIQDRA